MFDSRVRLKVSEDAILAAKNFLAVKAHINMINIIQFQSLGQECDNLVPPFVAQLSGGAAVCNFSVTCECSKSVWYIDAMQVFQLVRGLYDIEIQEKILTEVANREIKLKCKNC